MCLIGVHISSVVIAVIFTNISIDIEVKILWLVNRLFHNFNSNLFLSRNLLLLANKCNDQTNRLIHIQWKMLAYQFDFMNYLNIILDIILKPS